MQVTPAQHQIGLWRLLLLSSVVARHYTARHTTLRAGEMALCVRARVYMCIICALVAVHLGDHYGLRPRAWVSPHMSTAQLRGQLLGPSLLSAVQEKHMI